MIRISIPVTLILAAFLLSCSSNPNQYLLSDYENSEYEGTVALLPLELDQLFEEHSYHTFGALRPSERSHFDNRLASIFARATEADLYGVMNGFDQNQVEFEVKEFELGQGPVNILTPKEGSLLTHENMEPRYVVLFDQFRYEQYEQEIGGGSYASHESEIVLRMRFQTKYAIWDNEKGEAVAWGKVNTIHQLLENSAEMYDAMLEQTVRQIVNRSPFPPRRLQS